MSHRFALASLLVACIPAALAAGSSPPQPAGILSARGGDSDVRIFRSQVEIDTEGRVAQVTPEQATPQALRPALSAAVQQLRFAPALSNGQATGGTTFIAMRGCPKGGVAGAELGFRYAGHGPSWLTTSVPRFPKRALLEGIDGRIQVQLRVLPDGSAEYVSMDITKGGAPARRAYRDSIKDWAAQQRFAVEQLDGQAQPGTVTIPVAFAVGDLPRDMAEPADPCAVDAQDERAARPNSVFTLLGGA